MIYDIASQKNKKFQSHVLLYLFPFGSTKIDNVEIIHKNKFSVVPDFIILCYDQEPLNFEYNKDLLDNIVKLYDKKETINNFLFKEQTFFLKTYNNYITLVNSESSPQRKYKKELIFILLNTEQDSSEKNKIINHYNFIDCNYFFHALAASDWYRGYQYSPSILSPCKRKIEKKFITFNRITGNSRVYRSFLISELYQKKLLNYGHISYSKNCPVHGNYKQSILDAQEKYDIDSSYIEKLLININLIDDSLRIDSPPNQFIDNGSYDIGPSDQLNQSFLYVVTETCFWEQKKHLTEKIFKPIVNKMPFVLVGCSHNLEYLKSYGFKTFDRWWDESYDQIEDPIERLQAVVKIIDDICQMSNSDLEKILIEMEEILEHNFQRFYSRDFVDTVLNELELNLAKAIEIATNR